MPPDAALALRSNCRNGPGYCFTNGRGPSSCLLGQVTALTLCLYVKLFLGSIFNFVSFEAV